MNDRDAPFTEETLAQEIERRGLGEGLTEVVTMESVRLPSGSLYVNFDVNEYLSDHNEAEMWAMLGALKDFFNQ